MSTTAIGHPPAGTVYTPAGTVYGTLLNFRRECDQWAAQMTTAPYKAPPQAPVLYVKTANTFSASGQAVGVPPHVAQVEIGASLGLVMGPGSKPCAYVLLNDFSVPHASFFRPPVKFKCLDGFLGVGSLALEAKLLGDPALVQLEVRINAALVQTVDFAGLVRNAASLLADVTDFMALAEGDVLMLGCDSLPGGGRPLAKVGDQVVVSSPSHPTLGVLKNTMIAQTA